MALTEQEMKQELSVGETYTSLDADIKCELKHINDAMQFKGQAAREYVQGIQNSKLFMDAMVSLNRISETIRAYESLQKKLPQERSVERNYLQDKIEELSDPKEHISTIEKLEKNISETMKRDGIKRTDPILMPLDAQIDDLKNVDKLTHLVDVCSYISCRKTLPTDEFRRMGDLPDELSTYLEINLPEWKPDEEVFAAAEDWVIPESIEIDFDSFTNTSGYIEGAITERFKSLGMNMSLYMVPFNDCVIIDGKTVSKMFMEDTGSKYAYKWGQEQVTKKQERQYLAEQIGKALQQGLSVEIFLPDKNGKFAAATKITGKGLKKEGVADRAPDPELLLQAKGKFFIHRCHYLKGISPGMQQKLNMAAGRELPPNAYANAAEAVLKDMRQEKEAKYHMFSGDDQGELAGNQVRGLLEKAQDAKKSVWFGSPQYEEMVQAVEKLNQLTEQIAGHIDSESMEQMHAYRQALAEVRQKAESYLEFKKAEQNPKPKTRKRIDTAKEIAQYAEHMFRKVDGFMKQKVEELNRKAVVTDDEQREYLKNAALATSSQKEEYAEQLYQMFLQRLSARKAEDTYAALHTKEGHREFVKQAVTSRVVEKMQNNPKLIHERGQHLVDDLITEMTPKKEVEVPGKGEKQKEKIPAENTENLLLK